MPRVVVVVPESFESEEGGVKKTDKPKGFFQSIKVGAKGVAAKADKAFKKIKTKVSPCTSALEIARNERLIWNHGT